MKKLLMLTLIVLSFQNIHSQEIYFQTGKNFTNYDYKSDNSSAPSLQAGSGNFYEVGYCMKFNKQKFKYSIGMNLNEYNALGGNSINSYSWNTQYLGLQNTFSQAFVKTHGIEASINAGLGLSSIIYGKQNINGQFLDLSSQKEFSGLWITPKIGVQASYNINHNTFFSVGYAYSKGYNLSNSTQEKLSFNNNQIQFGIHFNVK